MALLRTLTGQKAAAPSENKGVLVDTPKCPVHSKQKSQLINCADLPKKTFHQVHKVIEVKDNEIFTFYLKDNLLDPKDAKAESPVSEYEACLGASYKIFAPALIPFTCGVYDEALKFVGVASEELPEFKPLSEDPLRLEEIDEGYLSKISILEIDILDKEFQELKKEMHSLDRQKEKLDYDENNLFAAIKADKKLENAVADIELISSLKSKLAVRMIESRKKLTAFYENLEKKNNITRKEFENFRAIKNLSICLVLSYFFLEDDLHQKNLGKMGRFDFDMSDWPILYAHKQGLDAVLFRAPTEKYRAVTISDLIAFPNLKDAKPYYWPTFSLAELTSILSNLYSASRIKAIKLSIKENAYTSSVTTLFQRLAKHQVFNFYKWNTLTKLIMPDASIFLNINLQHMREEWKTTDGKMSLVDHLALEHQQRAIIFARVLKFIPDFALFFKEHHERVKAEFMADLTLQGIKFNNEKLAAACTKFLESAKEALKRSNSGLGAGPSDGTEEVKAEVPTISLDVFIKVRTDVISSMAEYITPPGFGFFRARTHAVLAGEIKTFCENIKITDKESPLDLLKKIKKEIDAKQRTLPPGGMNDKLTALSLMIADKIPRAVKRKTAETSLGSPDKQLS